MGVLLVTVSPLLDIIRLNSLLSGLAITIGLYSQAIKLFRTRSAHDFSWALVIALLYAELSWLVYGIWIREWPVFLIAVANLPAEIAIVVGYIRYGRDIKNGQPPQ